MFALTISTRFVDQEANQGPLHKTMFKEPLVFENGYIIPPIGPGLGVELDMEAPWSVVAKVMDLDATSEIFAFSSPAREIQAYESGLLASIGSTDRSNLGFRAAKHYGVTEIAGLGTILWVEDLSAAVPPPWDDATYLEIARQVGHLNASWLLNPPQKQAWFLDDGITRILTPRLKLYTSITDYLDDAIVQRVITSEVVDILADLAKLLPTVLKRLNTGPRPLSHVDAQPRNLFPI